MVYLERYGIKMTIKKYRFYLVVLLIVTLVFGAIILIKSKEEEHTYRDSIMVHQECMMDRGQSL